MRTQRHVQKIFQNESKNKKKYKRREDEHRKNRQRKVKE